jgi:hypothetical protein
LFFKILNLKASWNSSDRKIWRTSQFFKTPCSETILILETPRHSSDGKIGGKSPIFQYTRPLKDSHLRSFLQLFLRQKRCSERILIKEVTWNNCDRKIGMPSPFFQPSCS